MTRKGFTPIILLLGITTIFLILLYSSSFLKTSSPLPSELPQPKTTYRILTIGFNPRENGTSFADTYFSEQMGMDSKELEQRVAYGTTLSLSKITGYQFNVVKSISVDTPYTYDDGFAYSLDSYKKCVYGGPYFEPQPCENRKYLFNYEKWIAENKICEIADENDIDEIWMLSLPYVMTWENFMIGPTKGFDVNGFTYVTPACKKHYIVLNGTYERPENLMHDIGHRVEATMNFLTQNWKAEDRKKYWEDFSSPIQYKDPKAPNGSCGNTHFPFNADSSYDYANETVSQNSCSDWKNFPDLKGTTAENSCRDWGCSDSGWQEFWLSNIPKSEGEVEMSTSKGKKFTFPKNWWPLLLSPDAAIMKEQELEGYF